MGKTNVIALAQLVKLRNIMSKQAAVFIDVPSEFRVISRINKNTRIDYEKLLTFIEESNSLHKAYAYGVQLDNESDKFIRALGHMGYIPRYRKAKTLSLLCQGCKKQINEKSIRSTSCLVDMSLDIVRNSTHVNKIIIGSNDLDIIPILEWIREQGILIEILSRNVPNQIKNLADKITDIPDNVLEIREEVF